MATPDTDNTKQVPLSELGGTGLRNTHGNIDEEVIRDLQFPQCINTYKQMETDALISGALFAVKQFIKGADWKVEEYTGIDKPADAAEQKRFLEQCMDDMEKSWGEVLTDILSFLTYGFSVHEIVYKKRLGMNPPGDRYKSLYNDGKVGWAKFPIRSQDSIDEFKTTPRGDIVNVHQKDYWNKIDVKIPYHKFLLFRTTSYKDNPYGQSILRGAYRAYYYRRNIEVFEAIGIERNLAGIPVLRVPSEILSPDADENAQQLRAMYETMGRMLKKNDQAYVMIPSDIYGNGDNGTGQYIYDIELMKSDGNAGQANQGPVIERYDRRIMMSMLTDFILTGSQSVGSYALASSKVDAFKTGISSYLDTIADEFNQKAIPLLWEYNGWDSSKTPKVTHTGVDKVEISPLADLLKKAGETGFITPDDNIENYLRKIIGLEPIQTEGDGNIMDRARREMEMNPEEDSNNSDEEPPINLIPET